MRYNEIEKDNNFIRIKLLELYETSLVMEKTLNLSSSAWSGVNSAFVGLAAQKHVLFDC